MMVQLKICCLFQLITYFSNSTNIVFADVMQEGNIQWVFKSYAFYARKIVLSNIPSHREECHQKQFVETMEGQAQ